MNTKQVSCKTIYAIFSNTIQFVKIQYQIKANPNSSQFKFKPIQGGETRGSRSCHITRWTRLCTDPYIKSSGMAGSPCTNPVFISNQVGWLGIHAPIPFSIPSGWSGRMSRYRLQIKEGWLGIHAPIPI